MGATAFDAFGFCHSQSRGFLADCHRFVADLELYLAQAWSMSESSVLAMVPSVRDTVVRTPAFPSALSRICR